jgi:hypothetical protein
MVKTVDSLNNAYHALSSYTNSANIVKIGIRCKDSGDFVRALNIDAVMSFYEQAFKTKMIVFGRHNFEVARMLHKMGKVAFQQRNYNLADSYISRAFLLYCMNKRGEDQEWVVDAYKDGADVDAAIVMGDGEGVLRVSLNRIFASHSCIHGYRIALFHFHEANFLLRYYFIQIGL